MNLKKYIVMLIVLGVLGLSTVASATTDYNVTYMSNIIDDKGTYWKLYDHNTNGPVNGPKNSAEDIIITFGNVDNPDKLKFKMGGRDWRSINVYASNDASTWTNIKNICCYGNGDYTADISGFSGVLYVKFHLSTGSCCGMNSYVELYKNIEASEKNTNSNLISSCTIITKPGEYHLTKDIVTGSIRKCINIRADNVILDCKGYMIYDPENMLAGPNALSTFISRGVYSNKNNITVKNCIIKGWHRGIEFYTTHNGNIYNNELYNNKYYDIYLNKNENTNITENKIHNNKYGTGIKLGYTAKGTIADNNIYSNKLQGIYLVRSTYNTIMDNEIKNNKYGIKMYNVARYNIIKNNRIVSNKNKGMDISFCSSRNKIYNNYFNNTYNAYDTKNNYWNTTNSTGPNIIGGPYIGGNYFSDYIYNDTDGDGFGEVPYNIPGGGSNTDYLPLAIPEVPTIFLSIGMMFLSLLSMKRKIN